MRYTIPQKTLLEMDEASRQTERQAQLYGSLESKISVLRNRLRQGNLTPSNLAMAGALGDEAADRLANELKILPTIRVQPKTGPYNTPYVVFRSSLLASSLTNQEVLNFLFDEIASTCLATPWHKELMELARRNPKEAAQLWDNTMGSGGTWSGREYTNHDMVAMHIAEAALFINHNDAFFYHAAHALSNAADLKGYGEIIQLVIELLLR